jgi:GAF domain-containing protein
VPVALVSVMTDAEQLILGAYGLPPEIDSARRLPLSHALCLRVVTGEAPVVVDDARVHPELTGHAAVTELDVVAYAGYPLRDDTEDVIGALCAIDREPRSWDPEQLAFLADLAAACSSELRLRGERERARRSQRLATDAHRHSRLLLMMAEAFTAATTVDEITRAVSRVAALGLGAPMTGIALMDRDGRGLTYTSMDAFDGQGVEALRHARLTDDRPIALAARTRAPLYFPDHASLVARFPTVGEAQEADGAEPRGNGGRAILPLVSRGRLLGVLTLGWLEPRDFRQDNREVKSALAGYTAQALERALLLDQRRDVARTLQDAMLTALPQPDHLRLAAHYLPAARADKVGGDWYDALVLPGGDLAVLVGDVTGHDMDAAARMGPPGRALVLAGPAGPRRRRPAAVHDRDRAGRPDLGARRGRDAGLLVERRAPAAGADPPRRGCPLPRPGHRPADRGGRLGHPARPLGRPAARRHAAALHRRPGRAAGRRDGPLAGPTGAGGRAAGLPRAAAPGGGAHRRAGGRPAGRRRGAAGGAGARARGPGRGHLTSRPHPARPAHSPG